MILSYANWSDTDLAVAAATDSSAHEAYAERMSYRDAITHLLSGNPWFEIHAGATYVDPESTGPIATSELSALLAPTWR